MLAAIAAVVLGVVVTLGTKVLGLFSTVRVP
jgi:hypothetical protein